MTTPDDDPTRVPADGAEALFPTTPALALVGKRVGNYKVTGGIAVGGMGVVYKAIQDRPRRVVALKTLKPGFDFDRFETECELLGGLRHPGIAHVYEAGTHEDEEGRPVPYLVMEYIPGARSITAYAGEWKLGARARLELMAGVCDAVQAAHRQGIAHLDLKPGNILVDADGRPRIIDFGVARAAMGELGGETCGTPGYMSPEQWAGDAHALDPRSDVFSLGVVLHELLCGTLPYGENDPRAATPAPAPGVEPGVAATLRRSLHPRRESRHRTAADLADDLRRHLRRGRRRVPVGRLGVAVAVVVLAVAAGLLLPRILATEPVTPPAPRRAWVPVRIVARWRESRTLREIEPPARPGDTHQLALELEADEPGTMLLFEIDPGRAAAFQSAYFDGPPDTCEPIACAGPGDAVAVRASFRPSMQAAGPHGVVAVLASPPVEPLCATLVGVLSRDWDPGGDPAELRAGFARALEPLAAVRGFDLYVYSVFHD